MSRASNDPSSVIYGTAIVSGTVLGIFRGGVNNEYLHLIVGLAGHEVQEITKVWLGDTLSTDSRFTGYVRVKVKYGSDTQAADADLLNEISGWTANHRLRGITYVYVRMKWSTAVWMNGIPNIKCEVKGRKVYDPRTATTAWSDNAALCLLDYLIGTRPLASGSQPIGIGATLAEIDTASWIAAANICDEHVALAAGGTQHRYTCNGSFSTDRKPIDVAGDIATAMGGIPPIFKQGKYYGYAAAYDVPTIDLDEDDLRAPFEVVTQLSRRERFNTVTGTYLDSSNANQPTSFPKVVSATGLAEDGEELIKDIVLPFTSNAITAQRLAKLTLQHGRFPVVVKLPCKLTALYVGTQDTVRLTLPSIGWDHEIFRVTDWRLAEDGGVDLTLLEENPTIYTWNAEETVIATPPTVEVNTGKTVTAPTNVTVTDQSIVEADGTVTNYLYLGWDAPTDAFVLDGGWAEVDVWDGSSDGGDTQGDGEEGGGPTNGDPGVGGGISV